MTIPVESTDVLVVGGGPAGSTVAAFLSRAGHKVVLLEKSSHPKFHIGESLLPMNLPILERLGVADQLAELGVPKMGADFTIPSRREKPLTYRFERALGHSPRHAYEVRRSEFDHMLFRNAGMEGAETIEQCEVISVTPLNNHAHKVHARHTDGIEKIWETRFLVDASGRDTFLARTHKWKKRSTKHASAAIYAHFRGVERREGDNAGNISLYWFSDGWMWMIPLHDDVMSIGAVCNPDYLRQRKGQDTAQFLINTLKLQPDAFSRMKNAVQVREAQVTGNYSYDSSRMSGPGYLLIGDAYAFIDPVFSSGVYLAMNSAEQAIQPIQHWLERDKRAYRVAAHKFEADIRRGLSAFSWFIVRFTTPAMRALFENPRNNWQVEQAIISFLAGDVFNNARVRRRIHLFRLIYAVASLLTFRETFNYWKRQRKSRRQSFE